MGWWKKRNKKLTLKRGADLLEDLIVCCDGKSNPIKLFSADEIRKATDNFSESKYASELSNFCYKWYSCKTENYHKILIKKVVVTFNAYQEENFCRDIAVSSMVSGHKNFLKLVGCCLELEGPLMVYDGVKKHYNLDVSEQPWKRRMKIAEDIATALAYLHTAFPRPFVYRTLHPGKLLLDEDGVVKLSDFSCCVSIPEGELFIKVDRIVGRYDYMDDNYKMSGVVSEKTDVFAIGRIMQNLLMGQDRFYPNVVEEEDAKEEGDGEGGDVDGSNDSATMSKIYELERQYHSILLKLVEERRIDEIADPEMLEKMGYISEEKLCQMNAFRMLSLRCVGRRGEVPTMVEVAKELKKIQRSLNNDSSSSPSGETQFDSAQDVSSTVLLSDIT